MSDNKQIMPNQFQDFIKELQSQLNIEGGKNKIPPVESWNPPFCGDIGMEIHKDGSWWHEGVRITRENLVKLFASILRKDEDGKTYLVTPAEKIIIKVEDAHFLGIRIDIKGEGEKQEVYVTTNMDDIIRIDNDHPLRVEINPKTREPRPYVNIRGRLEALLLRAPFYELVEKGQAKGDIFGIYSCGEFFKLDDLND